ncbi:general odorant-binding protein 19d [Anabrus simplex]|uniref:general odorant-binding protein 19d n=1 Tax=Anabrus simplex TaxID=316456 RepID=UPI0034DD1202
MNFKVSALVFASVCITLVVGQYTEKYKELVLRAADNCANSTGATKGDVENVAMHKPLETYTQACFQYCTYHYYDIQNWRQVNNVDHVLPFYEAVHEGDEERLQRGAQIVLECLNAGRAARSTNDSCLIAKAIQECFNNN